MNLTQVAADFGPYYGGVATIEFNALDFVSNGHAVLNTTAGTQTFRLDVTAGNFAPHALHFALMTGTGTRLCEGSANCPLATTTTTPIQSAFVGTPKPGNALGNVQWDGTNGTVSLAWTWLK